MRPATLSRRSVPSASIRSSLARAQPLDQPRLQRAQLAPRGGGVVAVEERRAADELGELGRAHAGPLGAGRGRPERAAPAPPQAGLAHRRAGAGRAGHPRRVDARERRHVVRRLDRERGVGLLGLGELGRRERVEVRVLRRRPPALGRARQLGPQQRPGPALEQLALDGEQQRRRERGRAHDDLLPRPRVEAVAAEQAGERVAGPSGAHGAVEVGEVLGEVLAQHVADPAALVLAREAVAAEQLLLARERLGAGDLPAHGEPLERNSAAPLPGVLARRRGRAAAPPRTRAASPATARRAARAGRRDGPRYSDSRRREAVALAAAAAAPAHQPSAAARSSWAATSPVSGSAWPGHAARRPQRRELADRRPRLLGVEVERVERQPRRPVQPGLRRRACRSSPTSARARRARGRARSSPARGRRSGRRGSRSRRRPPRWCRRSRTGPPSQRSNRCG